MESLDNAMDVINSIEEKESAHERPEAGSERELIGGVESFFKKINVAAIKLKKSLSTGDIIEIGSEEEAIRQKVVSMQINHEEVSEAHAGDSVGIKVNHPVYEGSEVYRLRRVANTTSEEL